MMCDSRRPLDGADSGDRLPNTVEVNGQFYLTATGFRKLAEQATADFHSPADCDRCEPDSYGLIEGRLCRCDCHSGLTANRRGVTWTGRDGVQR